MDFTIGGITVIALIFGLVEVAKGFGVTGRASQVLALVLGFVLVGVSQAISGELIPANIVPWVKLVVTSLAGSLAAMGLYDFATKRVLKH